MLSSSPAVPDAVVGGTLPWTRRRATSFFSTASRFVGFGSASHFVSSDVAARLVLLVMDCMGCIPDPQGRVSPHARLISSSLMPLSSASCHCLKRLRGPRIRSGEAVADHISQRLSVASQTQISSRTVAPSVTREAFPVKQHLHKHHVQGSVHRRVQTIKNTAAQKANSTEYQTRNHVSAMIPLAQPTTSYSVQHKRIPETFFSQRHVSLMATDLSFSLSP